MEIFTIPAVSGIIEKTEEGVDYVLIQDRLKKGAPIEKGLIEIPGGKIREYENIFDCLRREIFEETGLNVVEIKEEKESWIYEENGYKVLNYMPFCCSQNIQGYYPVALQTFICKVNGELFTGSNEAQNIRWISLSDLKKLMDVEKDCFFPMDFFALKRYLEVKACNNQI